MEKICRLCMSNAEDLISIFETIDEFDRSLANKISACLALEAVEGDGLPSEICKECATLLDVIYNFKEKCRASDWTLRKLKARVAHHHQFVGPVYKLMHETNPDINLDARLAKNLIGYHNAAPAEGPETFLVQKGPEVIAITVVDPNAPGDCVKHEAQSSLDGRSLYGCYNMDKHAELNVKLKHDREKALALNEHKKQGETMRKKEDWKLSQISKAKLNPVNETVQNSSSFPPQSARRIKINTANSKGNASVRVSYRIKNRVYNYAPTTQVAKSAPILEPEPLPSMSGICSSNVIVHENPVTAVVNSQSINRERKRRKLSNKQQELARLRVQKYRRNMSQEKKQQQKLKDNERYRKRKMMNMIKSVSEMTAKEKCLKRKEWRLHSKRYYHNKKLKLQSEKLNDCTSTIISHQIKTARKTSKEERSMSS